MNKCPALLLTCLLFLSSTLATSAAADPDDDRVRVTPMFGILAPDATPPWNSIESTEIYGGAIGVKVNRWFGINASVGYAWSSGDFGIGEDGSGGFVFGEGFGKPVDILHFGMDLSFHPLQGRLDPWVSAGIAFMRYDYEFDATGFKDWLSENSAEFDLADLNSANGYQFGIGLAFAFRVTDNSRWSVVADLRDLMVSSKKLEIDMSPDDPSVDGKILESSYGHNILFNIGIEMSWGSNSDEDATGGMSGE
jgi:hypothetical protein